MYAQEHSPPLSSGPFCLEQSAAAPTAMSKDIPGVLTIAIPVFAEPLETTEGEQVTPQRPGEYKKTRQANTPT